MRQMRLKAIVLVMVLLLTAGISAAGTLDEVHSGDI